MLSPSLPSKAANATAAMPNADDAAKSLKFISELGRSLLATVHPKKVASCVAEALRVRFDAPVCAFAAELENLGLITSISRKGKTKAELSREKFEKWLSFMPPQIAHAETDKDEFLIAGKAHSAEYIAPLFINGGISGAIVLALQNGVELTEADTRLIEAATQMAAMSVNLSAHYETTINNSISEAREEDRKFTEAILDALPVSLYVVDHDYKIVAWNRHREEGQLGIPRDIAVGRDVFDVLEKYPQGRHRAEFERAFRTGRIERIEQQTVADDGSTRHWLVSKVPMRDPNTRDVTHVITIGEDVTMRVEAVQAVSRAEKLAAVGRLAAGIVHEINNPLATIAACAESLEHRVADGEFVNSEAEADLKEFLELMKSEAFRCKSITSDLLDFSRVRTGERAPTDIGEVVRSAANLISHQKRGNGITQRVEIADNLPLVSADAGQIQQAVIALATNAIDAMPEGGILTFRVSERGDRVVIEVEDTGVGIPPENMSQIYEPFFTTKDVGKGTGLGLAVCYGIVSEHNGRLSVRSTPGKGTVFSISIPALKTE